MQGAPRQPPPAPLARAPCGPSPQVRPAAAAAAWPMTPRSQCLLMLCWVCPLLRARGDAGPCGATGTWSRPACTAAGALLSSDAMALHTATVRTAAACAGRRRRPFTAHALAPAGQSSTAGTTTLPQHRGRSQRAALHASCSGKNAGVRWGDSPAAERACGVKARIGCGRHGEGAARHWETVRGGFGRGAAHMRGQNERTGVTSATHGRHGQVPHAARPGSGRPGTGSLDTEFALAEAGAASPSASMMASLRGLMAV